MSNHLKFIHLQVSKSYDQLQKEIESVQLNRDNNNVHTSLLPCIERIVGEEVKLGGVSRIVRRVFIRSDDSGKYARLGWVLMNDVDCCMICVMKFKGLITSYPKYHCHACGNIVCGNCADNFSQVVEIELDRSVRVCKSCYFGQDLIQIETPEKSFLTTLLLPLSPSRSPKRLLKQILSPSLSSHRKKLTPIAIKSPSLFPMSITQTGSLFIPNDQNIDSDALTVVSDIDNEDNASSITKSKNEYSDYGMTIIKHHSDDSPTIIKHHSDDSPIIIKHHSDDSPIIIKHHSDDSPTIIKHHSDDSPTIIKHHSDDSPTIIKHHSDDSPIIIKHHSDDSPTIIKHHSDDSPTIIKHHSDNLPAIIKHHSDDSPTIIKLHSEVGFVTRFSATSKPSQIESLATNYPVTDDCSTFAVDYIQSIAAGNSPIAMQNLVDEYNESSNDYDDTRYNVSNQIDHEKYSLADGMDDDSFRYDDVIVTYDIGNFQATINDGHVDLMDGFAKTRVGHAETCIVDDDYRTNIKSNVIIVRRDIKKIFVDGNNNNRRFSMLSIISLLLIVIGYLAWHLLNMHNNKSNVKHSLTRKDIDDDDRYDLMKVTENVMIDVLLANHTYDVDVDFEHCNDDVTAAADGDDHDYSNDDHGNNDDSFIAMIEKDVENPNRLEYHHVLITRHTDTDTSINITLVIEPTTHVDDHSIEILGNTNNSNKNNRILLFRLQIFQSITSMINKLKHFVRSFLLIRF